MVAVGVVLVILLTMAFNPKRLAGIGVVAAVSVVQFSESLEAVLAVFGAYLVALFISGFVDIDEG